MALKKSKEGINERMFYALRVSEESRIPFLFISAPGVGKSTTVEMFAKIRGYELVMLRGNSISPETAMGFDIASMDPKAKTTVHLRPTWFDKLLDDEKNGKKTLLFLDEITTAQNHIQAALLHLVMERRCDNERIPDSTLIVSAGNYSQSLGSTFDMIAPLMNRFCIFNIVPDPTDIKAFLSKYDGAATGKMVDVIDEKIQMLKKLDAKALKVDKAQHDKIAEYIERGISDCVDQLMNSGSKVLDFKVTDLQGLYQDTDNDSTLKGFTTPRTLCFLRDATISAYFAFGKEGVLGRNYHLLVEGLCGIGLSRKGNNNEVVVTEIAKDFEQQMKLVVTEIDKMSNDKLPIYNKYFADLIDKCRDKKNNLQMTNEIVTAAYSKISEMLKDKDISGIERPLETQNLDPLVLGTQAYMAKIANINIDSSQNVENYISIEQLASIITQWNSCALLLSQLKSIIGDSKYGYTQATQNSFKETIDKARKYSFAINIVDRYMKQRKPEAKSLLPELNIKFTED